MTKARRKKKSSLATTRTIDSTPRGIILERVKRLRGLPHRPLDIISEFFVQHYLRHRRQSP